MSRKPLIWLAGLAAAAAALAIGFVSQKQASVPPVVAVKTEAPRLPAVVTAEATPPAAPPPRVRRRPRQSARPVEEVATEFLAMPYAPRFTAEDRGHVVRVRLPREAMLTVGLPVNQDRISTSVKADVLIGEDGIARAIRFVQ